MNVTTADIAPTRWRLFATATLVSGAVILFMLYGFREAVSLPLTLPALGAIGVTFLALAGVFRRTFTMATRTAGSQQLTVPTWITLGRGWALVLFVGVVILSPTNERLQWIAVGLFTLSAVADMIDGAVARYTETVSEWGGRLDTEVDALLVFVGTCAVVWLGRVPVAFLAVGLARYAFVAGCTLRRRRGLSVAPLVPSRFRKFTGGTIMLTIWIALLPVVDPVVSRTLAWIVLGPILGHFCWDWLAVSGRLE